MRLAPLCFAAALSAVIAACGGDARPAPPPVRLTVSTPRDLAVVRDDRVAVAGSVRPSSATVTVGGRRATVSEGAFHATISLAQGTNVVDVMASAGRARPALAAIRVRREVRVEVPDVVGTSADDARARLTALGLKADVQREDGIFDRLLPGAPNVCATDPESGTQVEPDSTVTLLVARNC